MMVDILVVHAEGALDLVTTVKRCVSLLFIAVCCA
jgi:hypothetical protein